MVPVIIAMHTDSEIINITQCVEICIDAAEQHFSTTFTRPSINFNVRGKAAGKAYLLLNQIRLNPILFSENRQAFFQQVIPHETAHIIVFQKFGKVRPHGKEWQYVMQEVLQRPALTTHAFDISSVSGKQFLYQCQCRKHLLSIRRHNKICKGKAVYHCVSCKQPLQFVGA